VEPNETNKYLQPIFVIPKITISIINYYLHFIILVVWTFLDASFFIMYLDIVV
jgi:hypothetical protein